MAPLHPPESHTFPPIAPPLPNMLLQHLLRTLSIPQYRRHPYSSPFPGVSNRERAFWRSKFCTLSEPLPLSPVAKSNSRKALTRYDTLDFIKEIDPSLAAKIKQASRTAKTMTFHFCVATLEVLSNRFLNIEDVCIGITDANRTDQSFLETMGFMQYLASTVRCRKQAELR